MRVYIKLKLSLKVLACRLLSGLGPLGALVCRLLSGLDPLGVLADLPSDRCVECLAVRPDTLSGLDPLGGLCSGSMPWKIWNDRGDCDDT